MAKTLLLFLMVFINIPYAQDFRSRAEEWEYYFQILLRNWYESANWQKLDPIDREVRRAYMRDGTEVVDIVKKALEEQYGITPYSRFSMIIRGDQFEYWMVQVQGVPNENEQIWFLISRISREILSMYQDTIKTFIEIPPTPAEDSVRLMRLRESDAQAFYSRLLRGAASHNIDLIIDSSMVVDFVTPIDSVTAINVAVASGVKHYGYKYRDSTVVALGARLMGDNNEHWMVYCILVPNSDIEENEGCYRHANYNYKRGQLLLWPFTRILPRCTITLFLISKENGQVLAIQQVVPPGGRAH